MLSHRHLRSALAAAVSLCAAGFAAAAGLTVETKYPPEAKYLRGTRIYPEFLLDMSRAADWARIGSTGGHKLTVSEADCPERPGKRGLMFSAKIDKKNPKAPGWVAWQAALSPELNLAGVDEIEFEIYPLQKFPFGVVARFGSTKGFGQLPCTWSDVVKGLEPKRWHTVRIPVKKSRLSVDTLRFDFNARGDAVPHQQELSMIIAAIRLLPAPHPATAVYSSGMKTAGPVTNGFLINPEPLEMAGGTDLKYSVELTVAREQEALLQVECGGKSFSRPVLLKAPCTVLDIRLPRPAELWEPGNHSLKTTVSTPAGEVVAKSAEAMPLSLFSTAAMNEKRMQLNARLSALEQRRKALEEGGTAAAMPGITSTAAELFLGHFIPDDFNRQKKYRIAMSELDDIETMLDGLETELAAYEAGKKRELPVTPYDPERELTVENGVICQNGQPILLLGPLAGMPAISWSRYATRLGFNSLVVETDMNHWLNFEKGSRQAIRKYPDLVRGPAELYTGENAVVADYLERCRANGLAANLLLSSHYCRELPGDLKNARSRSAGHNNFDWNVLAPEAKEAFRRMYGNLVPYLKEKPFLVSLGTANEPGYAVKADSAEFRAGFVAHLKRKYGSAAALNRAWGSRYQTPDEVALRDAMSPQAPSAAKVDWAEYLSAEVSLFYGFLRDRLLESLPGKQIWVKLMGDIGYEMLDEEDNIALGQNVAGSDSAWEFWLDHLRSLFPAYPVTNHEWHFVKGAHVSNPDYLAMRMYQGVTRGLQSGNIWRGMRADWESKGHGHVESFSRYPLGLNAIGRTAYRLRMHYPLLLRMQQFGGGRIRICYDKRNHLLLGKPYIDSIHTAYDRLRINPEGVRFTYPANAARGELRGLRLIAAGTLRHLPQEAAGALAEWVKEGGTLWLDGPAEWSDYSGRKLRLPDAFATALKHAGVSRFGRGAVVTDPAWQGYTDHMTGVTAWSGGRPNAGVECRALRGEGGKMEYLSVVNLEDKEQTVRFMDGSRPVRITGSDVWNDGAPAGGQETMSLPPFAIRLFRISL